MKVILLILLLLTLTSCSHRRGRLICEYGSPCRIEPAPLTKGTP